MKGERMVYTNFLGCPKYIRCSQFWPPVTSELLKRNEESFMLFVVHTFKRNLDNKFHLELRQINVTYIVIVILFFCCSTSFFFISMSCWTPSYGICASHVVFFYHGCIEVVLGQLPAYRMAVLFRGGERRIESGKPGRHGVVDVVFCVLFWAHGAIP